MAVAKLTAKQLAALQEWIDAAVPIMRLAHWQITAQELPPEDPDGSVDHDAYAGSFIRTNSDTAGIHLGDSFWKDTPEAQRETLTHELIHCHLYRLHDFTYDRLRAVDRGTASSLEEVAIEQLARIVAPLLPLPSIPRPT